MQLRIALVAVTLALASAAQDVRSESLERARRLYEEGSDRLQKGEVLAATLKLQALCAEFDNLCAASERPPLEDVRKLLWAGGDLAKNLHAHEEHVRIWRLAIDSMTRPGPSPTAELQHAHEQHYCALRRLGAYRGAKEALRVWPGLSPESRANRQRDLQWALDRSETVEAVFTSWIRARESLRSATALADPDGRAAKLAQVARALRPGVDRLRHLDVVQAVVRDWCWDYGWLLEQAGDFRQAARVWQAMYEGLKATSRVDNREIRDVLGRLVSALDSGGRTTEALTVLEDAYPEDPATLPVGDRLWTLSRRARLLASRGDIPVAMAALREWLALAAGHPGSVASSEVEDEKWRLAELHTGRGEYEVVVRLMREVLESRVRRCGEDSIDANNARNALAFALRQAGQYEEALRAGERVYDAYTRIHRLPDDHRRVQRARITLRDARFAAGDLHGALEQAEQWFEVFQRVARNPAELDDERLRLAYYRRRYGDLVGALELETTVRDHVASSEPVDEARLTQVLDRLAETRWELGDFEGVLQLRRRIGELRERFLVRTQSNLLARALDGGKATVRAAEDLMLANVDVASTLLAMGNVTGAKALFLEVLERIPEERRNESAVQVVRQGLVLTYGMAGEFDAAVDLQRKVLAARQSHFSEGDRTMVLTRLTLGQALVNAGHLEEGCSVLESVDDRLAKERAAGDYEAFAASGLLVQCAAMLGRERECVERVTAWAEAVRGFLHELTLPPRLMGARARLARPVVDGLLSLVLGCGTLPALPGLHEQALLSVAALRGIETRTARRLSALRDESDRQHDRALVRALQAVQRELLAAANNPELPIDIADAVGRKEQLQLERMRLSRAGLRFAEVSAKDLAAVLPERSCAITIAAFERYGTDAMTGASTRSQEYGALVLDASGAIRSVGLGDRQEIDDLIASCRDLASARNESERLGRQLQALRHRVFDPLAPMIPAGFTVFASMDDVLLLVPLDSLPLENGEPIGSRYPVRNLTSLLDLVPDHEAVASDVAPSLLTVGGINYDRVDEPAAQAAPIVPGAVRSPASAGTRFAALRHTAIEVKRIASEFHQAFADGEVIELVRGEAAKDRFAAAARRARFLHLATHGYLLARPDAAASDGPLQATAGLSPFVLTGLALSGANLPPDASGRRRGWLSAEELLSLDLRGCELVVLSACKTALGVERAGSGFASLAAALQGAGARRVVTTLWEIRDESAKELMVDFYRRMWRDGQAPAVALWEARDAARRSGMPYADWAGWILSGW